MNPKGIILSGGPNSVYEENSLTIDDEIFNLGIPCTWYLLRNAINATYKLEVV